jgi:hypothetical protein
MQSKHMHMDIKIHITSYKLHGHKAAIFRFKTPNKRNNGDNIRNINKTYYLGGGGGKKKKKGKIRFFFTLY